MGTDADEAQLVGPIQPVPVTGPAESGRDQAIAGGRDFFTGIGLLARGLRMYGSSPKLMLLGLIPAVIAAVLLVAALFALSYFAGDLAEWFTPFADNWGSGVRGFTRVAATVVIVGAGMLLSVLAYTAITLMIGEPFYEAISKRIDDQLGGVPHEVDVPFWRSLPRSAMDSARMLLFSAAVGLPLAVAGCIPVVGETVVPVLAAVIGGWFLAIELTGVPFERRGLRLADRRQTLKQHRSLALGFGVATFVCFLIPLGAVVVMPAAVAGATLLTRRLIGPSEVISRP